MEIAREKLAKLDTQEYVEYQRRVRRGDRIAAVLHALFFIVGIGLYVTACFFLISWITRLLPAKSDWPLCVGIAFVYAAFAGIGGLIEPMSFVWDWLVANFQWQGRRQLLERTFRPIEEDIEKDAIAILSDVGSACGARLKENLEVKDFLRRRQKWQPYYRLDLEKVKKNCALNDIALEIVDSNIEHIRFNTQKHYEFTALKNRLKNPYGDYDEVLFKLHQLYGRPESDTLEPSKRFERFGHKYSPRAPRGGVFKPATPVGANPLGLADDVVTPRAASTPAASARTREVPPSTPSEAAPSSEPRRTTVSVKPLSEIPVPVRRDAPRHKRISKISQEVYESMARMKSNIGARGELLALDYERQRVIDEEGSAYLKKLEHSSVVVGDGLGYDIRSIKDGKQIFIEVKTTTGNFSSGMFFTHTEYETMLEAKEQYYLYRVCRLNLETNLGELFVFDGMKKITEYFDFDPNAYVLRQKSAPANPTPNEYTGH